MFIPVYSPTLMIVSIPTRTAANCSTTSSVSEIVFLWNIIWNTLCRLRWTRWFGVARTMVVGYSRWVYIPIPSLLHMAVENFFKNTGWAIDAIGRRSRMSLFRLNQWFLICLQVWSSYSVLNVLYSLMQKSKVSEYLVAQREGKSLEEIACVLSF